MAQQTINPPANPHDAPNTGDGVEKGDSWFGFLTKAAAMFTDLYNRVTNNANNITAFAGGGQASALQLGYGTSRITTVATVGDSVKLPAAVPGARATVINSTNNALQLFGQGTDQINSVASATGVSQAGPSSCTYTCGVAGLWESNDTGDGYSGNFSTVSVVNGITAHAGGGQANATALTATINRVTTVGTAADSVVLPPAKHGMQLTVINAAAANSMNMFAASQTQGGVSGGDTMNTTQNGSFAIAAGKTALAVCAVDGTWHTVLTA